jgi:hypothetical protein
VEDITRAHNMSNIQEDNHLSPYHRRLSQPHKERTNEQEEEVKTIISHNDLKSEINSFFPARSSLSKSV